MYLRKKRHRSKEDKCIINHLHDLHMYGIPETKTIDFALPCLHIPHVSYGYRVDYTYAECFYSIFSFHNETMNIWSHLIGFICVVVTGIGMMVEYQDHHIPLMGRLATAIYCFGAGVCLFFSAVYHIFGCMSNSHQQLLLTLDMGGVAVLTGTSLFLWIAFGFQCTPVLSMVYSAFTGIIVLLGIIIAFLGSFHNDFAYYVRVLGYLGIGILCLVPSVHWYMITPDYIKRELVLGLAGTFACYAMGLGFFVSRVPERIFPDSYVATHIFPSHFLWHMMVCLAVAVLMKQATTYQELVAAQHCESEFPEYYS